MLSIERARRRSPFTVSASAVHNIVRGDGTVLTSLFKHLKGDKARRRNGAEYTPRFDPDAAVHETGDGRKAGTKFVVLSAHTGEPNGLPILSIRQQRPNDGGELTVGMSAVADLKARIPGLQGITWDMSTRGKHIAAFLLLGLLPIIKVHGRKTKRPVYIDTIEVTVAETVHQLRLFARPDGSAAIKVVNQGRETLVPLDTTQARMRDTANGCSWFIEARIPDSPEVPEELRNAIAWWRPQDSDDPARSARLAEHLRIHVEDTKYFQEGGRLLDP